MHRPSLAARIGSGSAGRWGRRQPRGGDSGGSKAVLAETFEEVGGRNVRYLVRNNGNIYIYNYIYINIYIIIL